MRSMLSLVFIAGFAMASPAPLTPSTRQTAYDLPLDISGDSGLPLDLSDVGALAGGAGLLGSHSRIAGIPIRRAKRGLLNGLDTSGVGISDSLTKGASLSNLGLGLGRPPSGDFSSKAATCPTGRRYCCKHVRRYDDPKNIGLLDGALLDDSITNGLVGLTCDLIVSSLAPGSCKNAVCCTSQYNSKQGLLNLGCALSTNL